MYEYPCKNCGDRAAGCHSTCEKYLNAQKESARLEQEARRKKVEDDLYNNYKVNVVEATKKRYKR